MNFFRKIVGSPYEKWKKDSLGHSKMHIGSFFKNFYTFWNVSYLVLEIENFEKYSPFFIWIFFIISHKSSSHETLVMGWTMIANYEIFYIKNFEKICFCIIFKHTFMILRVIYYILIYMYTIYLHVSLHYFLNIQISTEMLMEV